MTPLQNETFMTNLKVSLGLDIVEIFTGNTNMTLQNSFGLFIEEHFYTEDKVNIIKQRNYNDVG